MITRRKSLQFLSYASALGSGLLGGALPLPGYGQGASVEPQPLKIPALDNGSEEEGARKFQLRLQSGQTEFLPGVQTETLGINGSYLGPTLRFQRYGDVALQVTNGLPVDTSLHWHGFHLPPTEDGGPHQPIAPGASWNPQFRIVQYGGTYWYHSHVLHDSGEQVYRGLAGMIIVDDDEHPQSLPGEYGVDDVPLIIQDRRFNSQGQFSYNNRYEDIVMGMMGETILVNGTANPEFRPETTLVRFRVLNAANARSFHLALSDGREFQQIGGDGGLLSNPVAMTSLVLAPAERAEIVVRFQPGESVDLLSLGREVVPTTQPGAMPRMLNRLNSEAFTLLRLRCNSTLEDRETLVQELTSVYRLPESAAVNTRTFRLSMGAGMRSGEDRGPADGQRNGSGGGFGGGNYFINGRVMEMDYINERVPLNTTEIWEVSNDSPMMHPFHIHNGQFQLLDRNGNPPAANEMGWKDTVRVNPGEVVRLIMRFTDYADESNPYMYHCHILEHEDRGMMGQFVLV